jgi:uncharacterized protein
MSNRFVKNPAEVVKVHQKVFVTVLDVDLERRRISLSMKDNQLKPREVATKEERKKGERKPEKRQTQKRTFTNNPFVSVFDKKSQ